MNFQERADACIAQGALTNSKRPSTFVEGVYPTHLVRGKGPYVWDTKGTRYLDFICGLGCNLLGYAHEEVTKAICDQAQMGASLSLSTPLEVKVAEKLKLIFPFVDHLRFLKTGSEACMASLTIARAFHGGKRSVVYSEGYHGHAPEFVWLTPPAIGIPPQLTILPLKGNEDIVHLAAAVIVEPVITDPSPERIAWLRKLREDCTAAGTLLIFDEVITGFRYPRYSVSNYHEIQPDLIILGKAIANGMPLAVVAGKKEIMNCSEYFVSSTFAGETLSLAAADKTLDVLRSFPYRIETLWQKGEEWLREFNSIWPEMIRVEGYATRGRFEGDALVRALFFQEGVDSGLLFGPSWFYNFPLAEKAEVTLSAAKDILCKIKSGNVKLRGKMPQSPFADRVRAPMKSRSP